MGQKVHPVGLRLGIIRTWYSRWFADRANYTAFLHEDLKLRNFIKGRMYQAGISTIDIERTSQKVIINIHSAKPGMVIGKRGVEIEQLRTELQQKTGRQVYVNIHEVRVPEVDAQLVSENIAAQLTKRVSYRRVMKKSALLAMRAGAKGIKISCGGRLGGAEIARYERDVLGKVPLHTLRADIDYGHATSFASYGTSGVKVWIYKGDVLFSARKPAPGSVPGKVLEPAVAPVVPVPVAPVATSLATPPAAAPLSTPAATPPAAMAPVPVSPPVAKEGGE